MSDLQKLAAIIEEKHIELLASWRQAVRELPSARNLADPTLNDHIPLLLSELVSAFRLHSNDTVPEALANMSGFSHGLQRLDQHFDIAEIVAEYNVLRGCIHDLACVNNITLQGKPFHILNRTLDGAIGLAVQTYATEQAEQVKSRREEYLSFVVHDLRTPLNAISIATSVLEQQQTGCKHPAIAVGSLLSTLRRNVGTLTSLVANILEENTSHLSESLTVVHARTFELWPLIEDLLKDLCPVPESSGRKITNEVPYDVMMYGDANLLRRVFRNLLSNAIKYTPHGEIKIGAMIRGDHGSTESWVQDSGAGIPADRLESIFHKLTTDPDREDGLGLGLSIVENFVHAHNGNLSVESKEGVGTTFHVFLPGKMSE